MYSKLGVKISNEQFDIRIENSAFIRIGDYLNSKSSIEFRCKFCGKIFRKKPKDFNKLKCSCVDRKNEYLDYIKDKNIEIEDVFYNVRRKLLHKCLKCGNKFTSSPKVVKNSIYGCPFCAGTKISNEDYSKKLPLNIKVLEPYVNCYTKIKHKCTDCENIWDTKPNYILHMGCGCPFCSASKGEKLIKNLLEELDIKFETEFPINIEGKTYYYDFYLSEINIAIEYDGVQHFEPIDYFGGVEQYRIIKENDEIKNKWSIINGINIIRIPYYNIDILDLIVIEEIWKFIK